MPARQLSKEPTLSASDLTRRQRDVLAFLRKNATRFAHPPTLDELCRAMGLASRGSMHKHVQALVEAGLIEPLAQKQRGLRLAPEVDGRDDVPFHGYIAAGRPIDAVAGTETVEVPAALRGKRACYVLQVRGDSMIDDGILDGDRVVVESRDAAMNGEVVVALIDGSDATLKRIEQRPDVVILHPANAAMAPLRFAPERVRIQGVVVGLMRRYRGNKD
jgi:repressor LexA